MRLRLIAVRDNLVLRIETTESSVCKDEAIGHQTDYTLTGVYYINHRYGRSIAQKNSACRETPESKAG